MGVIKRLGLVTTVVPFFILCLVLTIVLVLLSPIWGLVYYIITGDDPWDDENMTFLLDIGINAVEWYMEKFNL